MDTYGAMEPADMNAMQSVFEQLLVDPGVTVNGAHWASLIHAYGCVQKDLEKALSIFDSIKEHPSTRRSSKSLPDAVVYEALINVFNTVRRTDLISQYHAKLQECGVHMTAYIANVLIKGYSLNGDIDRARAVFESLLDPPEGVAAPNNHAPHDSEQAIPVPVDAPVYREARRSSLIIVSSC
jgi:pentatricopeptide repeat protein